MRVLSPGELAGKTRFMLRYLDLMKQIMSECGQLEGGNPWHKHSVYMQGNWVT